ncbi:MAG TPA: LytS/YhcK type 5TM receptor domain-containing protein [Terriglobales bacterium]|nr:LytS/YhcK type 5TM receptor domain-containing protein [Terriglobales bacterium]
MDFHHVIEAAGIVAVGLAFYSYTRRWLERLPAWGRAVLTGLVFGGLAVVLMISRIILGEGLAIDARLVPIALIALVEGGPASLVAAVPAALYRIYLGGAGREAGLLGIFGTVVVATLVARWARRDGGARLRHTLALSGAVYGVTALSFVVLGARGMQLFAQVWLPFLILTLLGIGGVGRLFTEIERARAAEAARRETEALRAVNLLARGAAHEINNPLMVVSGNLDLLARQVAERAEEARRVERAQAGLERIKDIVARMNRITRIEADATHGEVPPMLDIRKSSAPDA